MRYVFIDAGAVGRAEGGSFFIAFCLGLRPLASATNALLVKSVGVMFILIAVTRPTMAVVVTPHLVRASGRRATSPA